MRPLSVLIAVVLGSALSLAIGLGMTWIVLQFLPEHSEAFAGERLPLLRAIVVFGATTAVSGASLYGELRSRRWRLLAHASTIAMLSVAVWIYWPR